LSRDRDDVGAQLPHVDGHPCRGLHRIDVDQRLAGRSHTRDERREVRHRPDLVVGELERDQARALGERLIERLGVHPTISVDRHRDDLEAELLEPQTGVEDRAMLHPCGHDAWAHGLAGPRATLDGEVDGFGATGGEHDLARVGAHDAGDGLACLVEGEAGAPTLGVR